MAEKRIQKQSGYTCPVCEIYIVCFFLSKLLQQRSGSQTFTGQHSETHLCVHVTSVCVPHLGSGYNAESGLGCQGLRACIAKSSYMRLLVLCHALSSETVKKENVRVGIDFIKIRLFTI